MDDLGSPSFWERLSVDPARLAVEVCLIDLTNLEATLQRQPALKAWVGATHEGARVAEERAKWELTRARARVYQSVAATPGKSVSGVEKPKTVALVEAEVDTHPDVVAAMVVYLAAQERRGALRAMTDALTDRRDMLVQLSAQHRAEKRDYA